ncbi:glutamate-5-semialdehyde dehydrogenase [Candidatus Poriferisodalis sp.]|uniref:glutamate-5-semialdehyde dehydrogenase n=1 Tax=Candidatus Poriferisodalis sp. TaxID=3101277 RepID=UPI003B011E7E
MPDVVSGTAPESTGSAVSAEVLALGERAKAAATVLAQAPGAVRDEALLSAADLLEEATDSVLAANRDDVANAEAAGTSATLVDRLRLDHGRIGAMAAGIRNVAALADPVGQRVDGWVRPNGLVVERVRVPLGVVAIIYESRPNVTSDAFGLCLKSANAAFLRGSSAALQSNIAIAEALREGVVKAGLPADALLLVTDIRHSAATEFMRLRSCIDCLIPRGGPALISSVLANATVPYVIDGDGNCHVYVDAAADLDMAADIVANAKLSRPSVCNAAESLLVHRAVAETFLPRIVGCLGDVELVGDAASRAISPQIGPASDDDFSTEFLALKMSVAVVAGLDEAVSHINRHGTGHSEAIVTGNLAAAQEFTRRVDAAAVLVNASTRFVDGEEFGFGAEIGISTQKLHARGPMGLTQLTTTKFVVTGQGHTRG